MSRASVTADARRLSGWPAPFFCACSTPSDHTPEAQRAAAAHATNMALAGAGCEEIEIPARTDRIPRWPGGYVGSIAHDAAMSVAVAVSRSHALTVGIDVERHDALDPADAALVLTDDEQRFVDGDAVRATRVWCAKESAYKAWCTALGVELDHVDPRTIVVTQTAPFALRIEARDELAGRVASIGSLRGRWQRLDDLVIVLVWKLAADRG